MRDVPQMQIWVVGNGTKKYRRFRYTVLIQKSSAVLCQTADSVVSAIFANIMTPLKIGQKICELTLCYFIDLFILKKNIMR